MVSGMKTSQIGKFIELEVPNYKKES